MKAAFRSLLIFLLTYSQAFGGAPVIWSGTRSQALTSKGFLLSDASVVDNDGDLNYIKNGHGEVSATGWATYDDGAATTPVNCTGGATITETLTQSTSSPLVGAGNLLLTKDAADRQGEGASYDFTIDNAYKSTPLMISMTVLGSANYAASDLGVYIYDVTNTTLITPAVVNLAAGTYTLQSFFVATTSTSYRLCIHTQSTNASAYTVQIDNVRVGPQKSLVGGAMGGPWAVTPTGTWVSNTTYTGSITRFGQWAKYDVKLALSGAPTSATLYIDVPTGYAADTSVAGYDLGTLRNQVLGYGTAVDASGLEYQFRVFYDPNSGSPRFQPFYQATQGAAGDPVYGANAFNATGPITWANGDRITMTIWYPVSTWASTNVQMASREVEEYAYNTSTSTTASDSTSFGYGSVGAQIQSITAELTRRVRFTSPIQPTDTLIFEVSIDGKKWINMAGGNAQLTGQISPYIYQGGSATYGAGKLEIINTTDVDVAFAPYRLPNSGSTYAGTGVSWAAAASNYWRVKKVSGGGVVGYPVSGRNLIGRIPTSSSDAPGTGYIGEYQIQSRLKSAATSLSDGVTTNITSSPLTLTAGVWDIYGSVGFLPAGTTNVAALRMGISKTSATFPASDTRSVPTDGEFSSIFAYPSSVVTNYDINFSTPAVRAVISSSTNFYLVAFPSFTVSTMTGYGAIWAVRVN